MLTHITSAIAICSCLLAGPPIGTQHTFDPRSQTRPPLPYTPAPIQDFPIQQLGNPIYPDTVPYKLGPIPWFTPNSTTTPPIVRVGQISPPRSNIVVLAESLNLDGTTTQRLMNFLIDTSLTALQPQYRFDFEVNGTILDFHLVDFGHDPHKHYQDTLVALIANKNESGSHTLSLSFHNETQWIEITSIDYNPDSTYSLLVDDTNADGSPDYFIANLDTGSLTIVESSIFGTYSSSELNKEFILPIGSSQPFTDSLQNEPFFVEYPNGYNPGTLHIKFIPDFKGFYIEFDEIELYGDRSASTLADMNGDGIKDIIALSDSRDFGLNIFLLPFTGEPTQPMFMPFREFGDRIPDYKKKYDQIPEEPYAHMNIHSVGDLDGDGIEEIAFYPDPDNRTGWILFDAGNFNDRRSIANTVELHGESFESPSQIIRHPITRDAFLDTNNDGIKDRIFATYAFPPGPLSDRNPNHIESAGIAFYSYLTNPYEKRMMLDDQDTIRALGHNYVFAADFDLDGSPEILTSPSRFVIYEDALGNHRRSQRGGTRIDSTDFRVQSTQLDSLPRPDLIGLPEGAGRLVPTIIMNPQVTPHEGSHIANESILHDIKQELIEELSNLGTDLQGTESRFCDAADFDNDGDLDVLYHQNVILSEKDAPYYEGDAVVILANDGEANFSAGPVSPINEFNGDYKILHLGITDADNDGDTDLLAMMDHETQHSDIGVGIYTNDGEGNFTFDRVIPIRQNYEWDDTNITLQQYWFEVMDIDNDGYEDAMILTIEHGRGDVHEIHIIYGSETGLADEPVAIAGGDAAEVTAIDLDGNGLKDLVTCSYRDENTAYKNTVTINFQTAPRVFGPSVSINDGLSASVNFTDLDNDGGIDMLSLIHDSNGLRVYKSLNQPCAADLNMDHTLNFFDVSLYLKLFSQRRPIVDLNRDGQFNFTDISAFLESFSSSCE